MVTATADGPTVSLSFANNFWGKDDAGYLPLLERMSAAKQTSDELKTFYNTRASIEDEYARKLLSLCRKPLGSQESGGLKISLDVMRGEVEAMAKQHQSIASQMKSELEEPLSAFAGAMKERRKIVQNGIEKLHKTKMQQTMAVNKSRDRYEQECLKIKNYLAQGHMVMGQEERKNKAKLEKTQINVATSNTEYENNVKTLEDTTARWNREWKAAADKFQDLEEERLDFTKSSLWSFANIASTVCVSDDASCEKIRLSLEKLEVEKDIMSFIQERGTGQEIPDPPKYINFCRGDLDSQSEASEDDYSVAQFPRSINPAYRSSSPQPSTYESHHDPNNAALQRDMGMDVESHAAREKTVTPQKAAHHAGASSADRRRRSYAQQQTPTQNKAPYDPDDFGPVPHDPYPMDGMTMLCRTGQPTPDMGSAVSSQVSSNLSAGMSSGRPSSRDSHSDYSIPTPYSSQELPSGKVSPTKSDMSDGTNALKKKSGFFQNHSPFRRKSTKDMNGAMATSNNRNSWQPSASQGSASSPARGINRASTYGVTESHHMMHDRTASPDPIDANASLALNVGQNVFPVSTPGRRRVSKGQTSPAAGEDDPIAQALAELKGVGKQSSVRVSADTYHGIAAPAPGTRGNVFGQVSTNNSAVAAGMRGTPPPSYDQQVARLGVPAAAVTSKAMKQTSQKFQEQTRSMFRPPANHQQQPPSSYGGGQHPGRAGSRTEYDMPRATSPAPLRSTSPRPGTKAGMSPQNLPSQQQYHQRQQSMNHRSVSPNPYAGSASRRQSFQQQTTPQRGDQGGYYQRASPSDVSPRAVSPSPYRSSRGSEYGGGGRPGSSMGSSMGGSMGGSMGRSGGGASDMSVQPYGGSDDGYGSARGRSRPGTSSSNSRAMGLYEGGSHQRSKSMADPNRQYTRDGRPIMHFARALYVYQAAIPEELSFSKGDILGVLRHQDDGWWEATVHGGSGHVGLVPSNYLQPC